MARQFVARARRARHAAGARRASLSLRAAVGATHRVRHQHGAARLRARHAAARLAERRGVARRSRRQARRAARVGHDRLGLRSPRQRLRRSVRACPGVPRSRSRRHLPRLRLPERRALVGRGYRRIDPAIWPAWAAGYRRTFEAERRAHPGLLRFCGCDWSEPAPDVCEILALEGIGPAEQNFYSYRRALELCLESRRLGKRTLLFCLRENPRHRRVLAGISRLVPGTLLSWRAADRPRGVWVNRRIPEWIDLSLGACTSAPPRSPLACGPISGATDSWSSISASVRSTIVDARSIRRTRS